MKDKPESERAQTRALAQALAPAAVVVLIAQACGSPLPNERPGSATDGSSATTNAESLAAQNAIGTRIRFHYADFYSLREPNPDTNCAGDGRTYYHPLDLRLPNASTLSSLGSTASAYAGPDSYAAAAGTTGPVAFAQNTLDPSATYKPSFVKNIAVDLTDANSPIASNQASACSLGNGSSVPPTSNCATFDYGALGGLPATLGGTMILIGGVQNHSYSGYYPSSVATYQGTSLGCGPVLPGLTSPTGATHCPTAMYALGIDTLPGSVATTGPSPLAPGISANGATGPISSWANLNANQSSSSSSSAPAPKGVAGAAVAYSIGLQRILLFSGAAPLSAVGPTGPGSDTVETWSYDLRTQTWVNLNSQPFVSNEILIMDDIDASNFTNRLTRAIGARSLFGYAPLPAMSLSQMSTDGVSDDLSGNIDITERIVAIGGLGTDSDVSKFAYKFNPTYGPEYIDTIRLDGFFPAGNPLIQWLDSHHTQLMSNYTLTSQFRPPFRGATAAPTGTLGYSFGMGTARNVTGTTTVSSFAVLAGGFDINAQNNATAGGVTDGTGSGGKMHYLGVEGTVAFPEESTGNFTRTPNDFDGVRLRPTIFTTLRERVNGVDAGADPPPRHGTVVPWYGGVTMLPGLSLEDNDLVYFGGTSCRDYVTDTTLTTTACDFGNPGRYWRMSDVGSGPITFNSIAANLPIALYPTAATGGWGGGTNAPRRAGMAAARGEDGSGNVIIVAWGGMSAPQTVTDTAVYVLYDGDGTPSDTSAILPTWMSTTPSGADIPVPLVNSAMVYSHVTRKFYVFGGHQIAGTVKTLGDTWELSVSGACPSCTFQWKRLSTAGGLTCYPNCPVARRSHRMVEVNYAYYAGTTNAASLEPFCNNPDAPCSFGIFMEGGTPNGFSSLSERWMFDPTANGGLGHWQRVDGFPPRHLATMASVEYNVTSQASVAHRTVMFGGETGLHSPQMAATSPTGATRYFVPPTLGDTYMYDFDTNNWNRVELLGKGYYLSIPSLSEELEARQAYAVNATCAGASCNPGFAEKTASNVYFPSPQIAELTPPPLSGAISVTRIFPAGTRTSTTPLEPLKIQEVFLIGGRLKDGRFNTFDRVYKFCSGTTGERQPTSVADANDDASCDAYDADTNPNSPGPLLGAVGRWLRKKPTATAFPATDPSGANYDVTPSSVKSFLGAGTYDPYNDKIVIFGGIGGESTAAAVTSITGRAVGTRLYEYTPPSKTYDDPTVTTDDYKKQGYWRAMPACSGYTGAISPSGRYGHSMTYDPLNRQIVIVGGYDVNGDPITQTVAYDDGTTQATYTLPEVITGKRIEVAGEVRPGGPVIPATSPLPCYHWERKTIFGNSLNIAGQIPPLTGIGHAATVFVPAGGYNTGFYSLFDDACSKAGPISTSDPSLNKLMAGGAYIDIDRSALGPNENVLLNITYIPLGTENQRPDGIQFKKAESAVLRVHLVKTGQNAESLKQVYQPRHIIYAATDQFPQVVQTLSVLAPPTGAVRQDQILIPLSIDPAIDRIRIERYSGSAVLIDASVYRMGYR